MNKNDAQQVIDLVLGVKGRVLTVTDLTVKNNEAVATIQTEASIVSLHNWFAKAGATNVSLVTEGLTRTTAVRFGK